MCLNSLKNSMEKLYLNTMKKLKNEKKWIEIERII